MTKSMTVGSPARLIALFTLPLFIGNIFQQLYSFTDAVVVGRLLGVNALASVGAASSLVFLLIGFTWGSSAGLAIPVAHAFGAGDLPRMRRCVAAGVYVSLVIAAFITVVGSLAARWLLGMLETPPELIDGSVTFLSIGFGFATATVAFNFLTAIIRALGDSRTPLFFLMLSCVLNAGLAYFFVGVAGLGIAGSALATVVAQFVAVSACLALIVRKMPALRMHRDDWHLGWPELIESARSGLAMGFQMSIIGVGTLILQYAINSLGADAVAAFTSAARVDQLACAPLNSFGLAMATYVAQNRGARQWLRIRVGVFRVCIMSVSLAVLLGTINICFGTSIVRLFVGSGADDVVDKAHLYLTISGTMYAFLGVLFVLRNTLQGLGLTGVPTLGGVMELTFRAVAGLVLVRYLGFTGVCLAAPLAWIGSLTPMAIAWAGQRRRLIAREHAEFHLTEKHLHPLPAMATT